MALLACIALYAFYFGNPLLFDDENLLPILETTAIPPFSGRFISRWTFRAEALLVGSDVAWLRAGNLLIHVFVVGMVYAVGYRLLGVGVERQEGEKRLLAGAGALLFALHPAASFGVAYLIQRTILLSTLFALVATWFHVYAQQKSEPRWYLAALLAFALSVFSKEHSVALPGVLVLLSYWLHREGYPWRWQWIWAMAAYGAISIWITVQVKSGVGLGVLYEPQAQGFAGLPEHSHLASMATQLVLFHKYLLLWIAPVPQAMSIDMQHDLPAYVLPWWGLAGLFGFLGIGIWSLRQIHRRSALALVAIALLWVQVLFVTEFWGVRLSEVFVLYRSYLWCVLIPLALVLAADMMIRSLSGGTVLTGAFVLCAAVALAVGLNYRLQVFSDEVAVWQEAVDRNQGVSWPGAGRAHNTLGAYLAQRGDLARAGRHFLTAIKLNPQHANAWCNLANYFNVQGRHRERDEAVRQVRSLKDAHPCLDFY